METLAEFQKEMPEKDKLRHAAMSRRWALEQAKKLSNKAAECDHHAMYESAHNLWERAKYFKLLADSKK